MIKRFLSAFLAGIMMLTVTAYAAQPAQSTTTNIADVTLTADASRGIAMQLSGLYQRDIAVGDTTRSAKIYIPSGAELGCYFVLVAVPDAKDTAAFLKNSGWISLADCYKFGIFAMEPQKQKWGDADDEMAYIEAAFKAAGDKKYYLPFPTYYLAGYGAGGTALQKYAMTQGINICSAVFIDASDIVPSYLNTMKTAKYDNSNIAYSEVPMPVWIISRTLSDNTKSVIDYWKTANECTAESYGYNGGSIFFQNQNTDSIFTPKSCSSVAVLQKAANYTDAAFTATLYNFLAKTTRYGGAADGNTLGARPDYTKLGVALKNMTGNGYKREYLVYVPASVKASGRAAPMVFALHGANQTYKMMFDISRWWEVADARSFILVMPTSTSPTGISTSWNSALNKESVDELAFIQALVQQVEKDYSIDTTRVYCSGQSNGCMMTNTIGLRLSQYFTALGATSGPIIQIDNPAAVATRSEQIPMYLILGEHDLWDYSFGENATSAGVRNTLTYWISRNSSGSINSYRSFVNNRYTNYVWSSTSGIPMVRYTVTAGRGHSFLPDELRMIWDEWFSCWQKDANGNNVYQAA